MSPTSSGERRAERRAAIDQSPMAFGRQGRPAYSSDKGLH
jgi:hypothetical protein